MFVDVEFGWPTKNMLFTSANYFIFLAIVFFVYCLLSRRRVPVLFLLLASYYFYALWNVRFLALVVLLSTTDFLLALGIGTLELWRIQTHRSALQGAFAPGQPKLATGFDLRETPLLGHSFGQPLRPVALHDIAYRDDESSRSASPSAP